MLAALTLFARAAVAVPPVVVDHFYISLDPQTFKAVQTNKWLKTTFAEVAKSTNSSGDDTWTGLYVYGVGSYIEIFSADKKFPEGTAGIGFSTTQVGGADDIYALLRTSLLGPRAERELMKLGSPTSQKPFAHIASFSGQDASGLNVWLMEFHEDYFHRNGVGVGSTEADMFAAYRAKTKTPYTGLMGNVSGLTLRPATGRADLETAFRCLGFAPGTDSATWHGPSNTLTFAPPQAKKPRYIISSATFTLRVKPLSPHTEHLGPHSTLTVKTDGTAEWRFQ